ncbi:putative monoacylglycerol lipase [Gordonia hirsuta DSM 44140 = NBRC 16056]|uniref:Monoacylglycerol lipase n=1 Tax=Gordonia hirsuta DSM 44140 = NBRC 16056 TaxID=1121927 RepID=L7LE83_9ACTN|nr:alpha/beta hydrolase [Gordonia hirsuta]GAC58363.1 putative monoacylglycerol lipase [Gordonia hirsuta DSM 44140 = NBRC 16056]
MSGASQRSLRGARGRTIVYDVYQPDGDAVAVVALVHGLGEHAGRYTHVIDRLTADGYVVIAPDHAGHGRSDGRLPSVHELGDLVVDLHRVIGSVERAGLPLYMIGHSMGGAVALTYALDYPDELTGLILSGPAVMPGDDLSPLMIKLAPVLGRLAPWLPGADLPVSAVSRDPAVVAAYEADPLIWHGKIPAGLGGSMLAAMATFPQRLPSLRVPTLVLHGGSDALTNPEGTRLVGRLGGGEVTTKIYPGLYHEIFNEPERDEVLDDVMAWLADH